MSFESLHFLQNGSNVATILEVWTKQMLTYETKQDKLVKEVLPYILEDTAYLEINQRSSPYEPVNQLSFQGFPVVLNQSSPTHF